jgi:hypothetical protein
MIPEIFDSSTVAPLPLYTVIAPSSAVGRMQEKTGMPIRSRLVISATRVMPAAGTFGFDAGEGLY